MGSEQSSQANPRIRQLHRGITVPESNLPENDIIEPSRPGSISPGPSVCSDLDLPYISYTVNRPIGDSPKLPAKQQVPVTRGKSLSGTSGILLTPGRRVGLRKSLSVRATAASPPHNIVIVKHAHSQETIEKDTDISRLQSIPMFLPIMRGTLNLPAVRDPEILERINPGALYNLCFLYQTHLHQCAEIVAEDQTNLSNNIKEVDSDVARFMQLMSERQRTFANYTERISKVNDLSHQLNKCHLELNQTLEILEAFNNALPTDYRLEPFVWTTG